MIRRFGGHLGTMVSALVDGQLDAETAERAWDHVLSCPTCRGQVEREAWVKRRLSSMCGNEPSADLLGSLHGLAAQSSPTLEGLQAWAEVDRLEHSTRGRRRAGLAVAGAGGVSAAVLGFAALSSLGLGGAGGGSPSASITGSTQAPSPATAVLPAVARVHGRLPAWVVPANDPKVDPVPAKAVIARR